MYANTKCDLRIIKIVNKNFKGIKKCMQRSFLKIYIKKVIINNKDVNFICECY